MAEFRIIAYVVSGETAPRECFRDSAGQILINQKMYH